MEPPGRPEERDGEQDGADEDGQDTHHGPDEDRDREGERLQDEGVLR